MGDLLRGPESLLHILRNPCGFSKEEIKYAQLEACDWIDRLQDNYTNMRDWAEKNGVDTTCVDGKVDPNWGDK